MKHVLLLIHRSLKRPKSLTKLLFSLLLMMGLSSVVHAQVVVTGKVTDDTGSGLPGVNVVLKSTTVGTTTDANGVYTISISDASDQSVLVYSFIGFDTQEQPIGGRTKIDVSLAPNIQALNEVVVVGYGTQQKRDVTGAVTKVTSETLMMTAAPNIYDQLKGNAAGVDIQSTSGVPGGASRIRIRGNRTLTASSSSPGNDANAADNIDAPLIVLDGIPYSGSISDFSPNDIASLEILKDASATAIYGSRGAGGVILITTKRGVKGKTEVTYDGYVGVSTLMKELRVLNGPEYAQLKTDAALGNSNIYNTNPVGTPSATNSGYQLTQPEKDALAAGISTDWQKLIYKNAPSQSHNLTVSGGDEKGRYSLSAGYYKIGGIIPNQDYSRYSIRTTIDRDINNHIKVGINSLNTLSYQNQPGGNGVPNALMHITPLASPYNADGTINLLPQAGQTDGSQVSPLTLINSSQAILSRTRRLRTFNSLYGEVEILKGLKYRANIGLDFSQQQDDSYSGPNTYVNASTAQSQAQASIRNNETWQYTVENLLLYEKTFAEKHKLGFTGLYSFQKQHTQASGFFGVGMPADYMQNTNLGAALQYQPVNPQNQADNPNFFNERGLVSFMGRVTYSFDGRYSLTATVRRDGTSILSPGHQYLNYPAVAAAWNISNEKFMSGVQVVSNLKLRAGYGVTANQGFGPYQTLGALTTSAYNFGAGTSGNQLGYIVGSAPSNNLSWQSTGQSNIGLEFGLLNNRITGTVEVYSQNTKDLLVQRNLAPSNGLPSVNTNVAKTKGHGLEISLSTVNVKTASGFTWNTDLNYFFNREQIVSLTGSDQNNIQNGWFVGQPITVIYDYKKIGIWQTGEDASGITSQNFHPGQIKIQDINSSGSVTSQNTNGDHVPDGKITSDDRQILGNFQPKWEGGINNRFTFKRIDFSFNIYARMGMMVVVPYLAAESGGSNNNGFNWFLSSRQNMLKVDYWTPSNPTNAFPQPDANLTAPLYSSTLSYVDGSFIKVRTINLGYNIPTAFLSKWKITSLRVYASVVNPFVLYSPFVKAGYGPDPEGNGYGGAVSSTGNAAFGNGVQNGGAPNRAVTVNANAPATRQFTFGVNLKF